MTRRLSWLWSPLLCAQLASACTHDGFVGTAFDAAAACDAACAADQVCDSQSNTCVALADSGADSGGVTCPDGNCPTCPDGGQDCELPDECDDCAPTDTACIALFCRSCDGNEDCLADEPRCVQGRCMEAFDP